MNGYDEVYDIRLADRNDIESIMMFIELNWNKDHILAKNQSFFEYEFCEDDGSVNFIIAIKRETQIIEGILGFLRTSHDPDCMDVWGCMWRVKEGSMQFLGLELARRMQSLTKCRYYIGTGINPRTSVPILRKMMRFVIGRMKQYYFLGNVDEFKLAVIANPPKITPRTTDSTNIVVRQLESITDITRDYCFEDHKNCIPYKDAAYVEKRFFRHPVYQYMIYGIYVKDKLSAFFVAREDSANGSTALRIVDYYGEQEYFGELYPFFEKIVLENGYEYIDFYCEGFNEAYILDAGFVLRREADGNIIPNYFHPFVQKNVEIITHAPFSGVIFYKADADQDRPN